MTLRSWLWTCAHWLQSTLYGKKFASHWLYVSQGKHVDVLEEDGAVLPCAEPIHTSAVILSPGTLVLDLSTNDPS